MVSTRTLLQYALDLRQSEQSVLAVIVCINCKITGNEQTRMSDEHIPWITAAELTPAFARRELSPVELVDAMLKRAERLQPHLNALVLIDGEGAAPAAQASEARWRKGEPLSPLDGVPTTIKDTTTVKGWPTRYGSHATDETPAAEDAPVVGRLRAAGLALLGKSDHAGVRLEGADRFAAAGHDAQPLEPRSIRPAARRAAPRR